MSEQNGWISIDDARFTLSKYVGGEIVIRTKANNGRWVYQIAIVDEDGKVVIDPCVMCSQCGGTLQWKPHTWNPFSKMPMDKPNPHDQTYLDAFGQAKAKVTCQPPGWQKFNGAYSGQVKCIVR